MQTFWIQGERRQFGRYHIPLFRIWDVKNRRYVIGLIGSRREISLQLNDWLANNFANPKQARRNFRISRVMVEVSTSPMNRELSVRVVN